MDDLLEQGITAYKAGKRDEARKIFLAVVKQNPDDERAWGWVYLVASDNQERINCMEQALRINPANAKAKQLLAQLFAAASDSKSPVARKKKSGNFRNILLIAAFLIVICAVASIGGYIIYTRAAALPAAVPNQSASTPTFAPTATFTSTATETATPTLTVAPTATTFRIPTAVPGKVLIPVELLAASIPWLPQPEGPVPTAFFFIFNVSKPPFDNPLVRQAFLAATDRTFLLNAVTQSKCPCEDNIRLATTLIPPAILGRDLFNEVGVPYDPVRAKELLAQAGYAAPGSFPVITLVNERDSTPFIAKMWEQNLGITIKVDASYEGYMAVDTNTTVEMRAMLWSADFNDPDNFMRGIFRSDAKDNWGKFSSPEFDQLVDRAAAMTDPVERQALYIQAERLLCETEAAIIPIYHGVLTKTP